MKWIVGKWYIGGIKDSKAAICIGAGMAVSFAPWNAEEREGEVVRVWGADGRAVWTSDDPATVAKVWEMVNAADG